MREARTPDALGHRKPARSPGCAQAQQQVPELAQKRPLGWSC
jgi:hypothetical protein